MTPDTDKREDLPKWIYSQFIDNYNKLLLENKELKWIRDNREEKIADLEIEICRLKEEIKDLREKDNSTIADIAKKCKKLWEDKDFFYRSAEQFREDSERWRKEVERLLWLQICWKTVSEWIEEDKKVIRE